MGIPRLREITMTASTSIKTPMLKLPIKPGVSREQAEDLCRKFYRLRLLELLENITVEDTLYEPKGYGDRMRQYRVKLFLRHMDKHEQVYGLSVAKLREHVEVQFIPKLLLLLAKELAKTAGKKAGSSGIVRRAKKAAETANEEAENSSKNKAGQDEDSDGDDGEEKEEVDRDAGAGVEQQMAKKGEMPSYGGDNSDSDDVDEEGDKVLTCEPALSCACRWLERMPTLRLQRLIKHSKPRQRGLAGQLEHGEIDCFLWSTFMTSPMGVIMTCSGQSWCCMSTHLKGRFYSLI